MIGGLVFECGGCGQRLQAITEGRDEFAAELEAIPHPEEGKRMVGRYNSAMGAMAVLADDEGVWCPYCKHRNLFPPGSHRAERN